ncbi:Sec1 family superfamily [Pseudomassariella vexata]|uniref:Sec1 family superfamily n=1 Tax=Pseudomassariella vexata TaxID=1141098 RepID=A0A1Y2E186_9PEZI|nr:Sec1 family superfamily [Pseudomassariella vexata]ORY65302.1 Sec1 family superfamily [Pseudomassariella vexata]
MGVSVIQEQHDIIVDTIKQITQGDWKVLVIDENSKKVIDNVVKEDDILNQNIANIERIEERRPMNPTMDAIYILSPQPHIVDCLIADLESRRYRKSFLVWTGVLEPSLRRRIDSSPLAKQQLGGFQTLSIDYFPKESHLVTFKDPWSFPVLYHPACNGLVAKHMRDLAQKITGLCVSLGEYPKVRYYRPRAPIHEAAVLSSHLARFVSEELDEYAQWNPNFPSPTSRPQGILLVTDRSMDLMAPLIHEFTYQAMAHDLLPIKEGDKTTFHMTVNEDSPEAEEKDMELGDKDKVWVDNRHRHMKDTIEKLMGDFQKFLDQNPHFTNKDGDTTSLNAIKDMLAGLPQFQEMKETYSLHLTMAQECMNIFQHHKLPDIASSEQTLATGLDEDFRKPKNVLEGVVRLLDDDAITQSDRLRLVIMYILYRGGVIMEDIKRLLSHASLPPQDGEIIANLEFLGGRTTHGLKDSKGDLTPIFPIDTKNLVPNEEYSLSRFQPVLKPLLENLCRGALDQTQFPYVKPPLDPNEDAIVGQGSLRAAKPSWAGAGRRVVENRQRIIIFMAGGATYSESRVCYEVGSALSRDIFLASSHMLTPELFVRQVGDLSVDKRRLDLPMDRPAPRAPAHLFERPAPPTAAATPPPGQRLPGAPIGRVPAPGGLPGGPRLRDATSQPPTQAMGSMSLGSGAAFSPANGGALRPAVPSPSPAPSGSSEKPHKLEKEKKKRGLFGMKKHSHG